MVALPHTAKQNYYKNLQKKGYMPFLVKNSKISKNNNHIDVKSLIKIIGDMGYRDIIVESGSGILSLFYKNNLYDRIYWFFGNKFLGKEGTKPFNFVITNIKEAHKNNILGYIGFYDSFIAILEPESNSHHRLL